MKVALIPPISQLHYLNARRYQMMLPSFAKYSTYAKYYKLFCDRAQYYVMLDCGAFEGETLSAKQLLDMANQFWVDEVVPPDVLGDASASFKMLADFIAKYKHPSRRFDNKPAIAAAVQGKTELECEQYIDHIVESGLFSAVKTIALPKHLPETTHVYNVRANLTRYVMSRYPAVFDIHYLGFVGRGDTLEGAELGVRSMDTTAPFVCTAELVAMSGNLCGHHLGFLEVPPRPSNYHALSREYFHPKLVGPNIDALDGWAATGIAKERKR